MLKTIIFLLEKLDFFLDDLSENWREKIETFFKPDTVYVPCQMEMALSEGLKLQEGQGSTGVLEDLKLPPESETKFYREGPLVNYDYKDKFDDEQKKEN